LVDSHSFVKTSTGSLPSESLCDSPADALAGGESSCRKWAAGVGRAHENALIFDPAHRFGKKLEWDPVKLKAKNTPEADRLIHKTYHHGWKLA